MKKKKSMRFPLADGLAIADQVLARLACHEAIIRYSYVGSLRRMQETVGDVDLIAVSQCPQKIIEAFLSLNQWTRWRTIKKRGFTKAVAYTSDGIRVGLWVVPPTMYGAALLAFSGTAFHVDAIHKRTLQRTYGIFSGSIRHWCSSFESQPDTLVRLLSDANVETSEEELYEFLGMQWVPPPLREGGGDIKAALKRRIPRLVQLSDLRGDIHCPTLPADGFANIRDLAFAAADRGYEYFAITDNSQNLNDCSIRRQNTEIRKMNKELRGGLTVLFGIEVDIGPSGELNYPLDGVEGVDIVIASIHDCGEQSPSEVTHRLLKAIEHPRVNIVGHPDARWIRERKSYPFDLDAVFQTASRHQVALEIDANPKKMPLPDDYVRRAVASGAKLALSAAALCVDDLAYVRLAVGAAQRGCATAEHVVNTWPLERLRQFLIKAGAQRNAC